MSELNLEKNEQHQIVKNIVKDVVSQLGYEATLEVLPNEKDPTLKVISIYSPDDLSMLIGKNGQNLKAIEHITKVIAFKKAPGQINFALDINDYRKSRAKVIVKSAVEVANRVRDNKKAEALVPMSSYERRLVHIELASYPDIETESIGEEPQRRVVIRPLTI
ncbi:MAG: R3H domain-containing nucleic acid-binding protein [bacterium]|nr:R3H domain-containing nucleic acid-binding protein [bacterium]